MSIFIIQNLSLTRKKIYADLATLQADVDEWIRGENL